MQCKVFDEIFDLMHNIEDRFNATIFIQKRIFFNNANDEVNNAEDDRISIEKIAKKVIDFDVQMLTFLHCFFSVFADSISMLEIMKKINI